MRSLTQSDFTHRLPTMQGRFLRSWGLGILAMVAVASSAGAHPKPIHDGFPPMNAFAKKLSLSTEQKASSKTAAEAVAAANKSVRTAIEIKHVQLKALWAEEVPNKVMILAKLAEVEALRRELIEAHVAAQLSFIASLSVTQQAEFRRLLKAMPSPRGHME